MSRYRFTFQPRSLAEYQEMCHFHQTSPESSFTKRRVCTRLTTDGRITLSDLRMILSGRGVRREARLTEDEWKRMLVDRFGFDPAEVSAM